MLKNRHSPFVDAMSTAVIILLLMVFPSACIKFPQISPDPALSGKEPIEERSSPYVERPAKKKKSSPKPVVDSNSETKSKIAETPKEIPNSLPPEISAGPTALIAENESAEPMKVEPESELPVLKPVEIPDPPIISAKPDLEPEPTPSVPIAPPEDLIGGGPKKLIFDADNENRIVEAEGGEVVVNASDSVFVISGGCTNLTVTGSNNQIQCDKSDNLDVKGDGNFLVIGNLGEGIISGNQNEVSWGRSIKKGQDFPDLKSVGSDNLMKRLE